MLLIASTLGARGVFLRSEAAIVKGEAAIEILARENLDRGFPVHNHSFALGSQGKSRVTSVVKWGKVRVTPDSKKI